MFDVAVCVVVRCRCLWLMWLLISCSIVVDVCCLVAGGVARYLSLVVVVVVCCCYVLSSLLLLVDLGRVVFVV